MSRIDKKFKELKAKKKKALIVFITAGDPDLKKNEELALAFEKDGVDLIELGVPFSDPLADGPVIQASSERSLKRGTTLAKILSLAKNIRRKSQIPLVLMSYINPILSYGAAKFAKDAKASGVDGVILPDVPLEEGREFSTIFKKAKLDLVYLLAPTSTPDRKLRIAAASRGFIYFVSMTGVTGGKNTVLQSVDEDVHSIKKVSKLPVCVGFGISTPEQAKTMSRVSDGVIVGSAVVRALHKHAKTPAALFSKKFIRPFANAVKGAR